MSSEQGFLEREAEAMRDGSIIMGLGASALGILIESPKIALLGAATLLGSAAFEGLRRFMHREDEQHIGGSSNG